MTWKMKASTQRFVKVLLLGCAIVMVGAISVSAASPSVAGGVAIQPPAEQSSQDKPADWSRFRGPNGSGLAKTGALPVEMGPEKNVIWKTELPPGHSSPILSADRIFLTAFEGELLFTYSLSRETGEVLWRREAPRSREERIDPRNSPASPSPVTDGENVYVFFADFGLLSYDFEGNERWQHELGPFNNLYGMGASPILVDDKVVLVCDQGTDSYVLALAKKDGSIAWKTDRPEASSGHSTPILWQPEGEPAQLLVPGSFLLTAYTVDTGEKIWWVSGLSFEMKSTPVIHKGLIFVNGYGSPINQPGNHVEMPPFAEALAEYDSDGDGQLSRAEVAGTQAASWYDFVDRRHDGLMDLADWDYFLAALASTNGMLAVRLGGSGDMTDESVIWTYHRAVPQLPSPLIYGDVLYMVNDGGIVTSFNAETGEVLDQGRLQGAVDSYYASPVAADGKIYFLSELGLQAVIEPGGALEVVTVNDFDDLSYATPAIADGRIYLRTRGALYCLGLE
jgi:outer membrane protein assembly factor BamB